VPPRSGVLHRTPDPRARRRGARRAKGTRGRALPGPRGVRGSRADDVSPPLIPVARSQDLAPPVQDRVPRPSAPGWRTEGTASGARRIRRGRVRVCAGATPGFATAYHNSNVPDARARPELSEEVQRESRGRKCGSRGTIGVACRMASTAPVERCPRVAWVRRVAPSSGTVEWHCQVALPSGTVAWVPSRGYAEWHSRRCRRVALSRRLPTSGRRFSGRLGSRPAVAPEGIGRRFACRPERPARCGSFLPSGGG